MQPSEEKAAKGGLRDYLAAERTFLAWVRTGLALMGFGFVVARFGLFLQKLQIFQAAGPPTSSGPSLWFGTALIAVGVLVNLSAARQHARLVRQLDRGAPPPARSLGQNVAIALFLALVGIAMAIYLVSVRNSPATPAGKNAHSALNEEYRIGSNARVHCAFLARRVYETSGAPAICSRILYGANCGATSALGGIRKVCSMANRPESTACATPSVKTSQVDPGGNSMRIFGHLA